MYRVAILYYILIFFYKLINKWHHFNMERPFNIALTLIQTDVRLDPNQTENGNYNLNSVWFNKISKRFLCVYYGHTQKLAFAFITTGALLTVYLLDYTSTA